MSSFYDENNHDFKNSTKIQEMRNKKFGLEIRPKRRALSMLNQSILEAQARSCVVTKRPISERSAMPISSSQNHCKQESKKQKPSVIPISSSQNHCQQESKKQKPSARKTNESGDCIFIDEEDNKGAADQAVPMSLEPTKPTTKIVQMEEIEMEDIEEPIEDIDSCDSKNPLAVVDYVEDMLAFYRKMETLSCVDPNYMAQQADINEKMRAILIDWLIEVHDKCELLIETLFLCVNLIDRFLSQQPVIRKKLQLIGLVAMLLACKYEEVSVPPVGDLIIISDKSCNRKDILEMEKLMLNKLHFNMSLPTPYVFIRRFLKAAQCEKKIELLSFYLIELSLVEYEMLRFPPSLLAASAIYTAQCTINGFKHWSRTCEWHSNYLEDQLLECSRLMLGYHQKAGTGKLTGVYRKYNTSKFDYISKCEAATFLLETKDSNDMDNNRLCT